MLNLDLQNELRELYREKRPDWQPATELYAALCRSYIHENDLVMDLGCGRGGLIEQLNHSNRKQFGMDLDMESLINHRLAGFPRFFAPSEFPPIPDGCVDHVVSSWLLEHLDQPEKTFRQIKRVLKPGGFFMFITPNGKHPLALLNGLFGRLNRLQGILVRGFYGRSAEDTFPTRYRANSMADLNKLASDTGFEVVTIAPVPDPTYLAFTPSLFTLACLLEENIPATRHTHLVGIMKSV